eukprot:795447-Pelagomonas_calceolata.AAC.2
MSSVTNNHPYNNCPAPPQPDLGFLGWTKEGYMCWQRCHPGHTVVLAKFPSESLAFQPPHIHLLPHAPPKTNVRHTQLVVIWDNDGKQPCFMIINLSGLKD